MGRNLDVYAADMARISIGWSTRHIVWCKLPTGVVRMITNKPVIGETSGNVEVESRFIPDGDSGAKVELVGNIPIGESTAARLVAYRDKKVVI